VKRLSLILLCGVLLLRVAPAEAVPLPARESKVTVRLFTEAGQTGPILDRVLELGGTARVHLPDVHYLAVEVTPAVAAEISQMEGVLASSYEGQPIGGSSYLTGRVVDRYDHLIQQNNLNAVRIPDLRAATGATGRGVTIAVIDTGIDASHPDLRLTPLGLRKIVDWKDFSGEGYVDTRRVAMSKDGFISTAYGQVRLGPITSKSGRYRYGVFREEQLDPHGTIRGDVNGNGSSREQFIVVAVDSTTAGVYDYVYVDTNGNLDLSDEVGLQVYSKSGQHNYFQSRGKPQYLCYVVADMDPSGSFVSLGFDGNGHGTHVSGLMASGGYRMTGAAPGARLMALKALTSSGDGSWEDIASAMTYAAENGAHIISISAAGVLSNASLDSPESLLMAELGRRYGVVFVIASGNDGPGLGTASTPGHPYYTITVGAYLSPSMWKSIYGHSVASEGVWLFSSPGPRPDGSLAPDVVAPGSAVSSVPTFYSPSGYAIMAGTSMAVPYVAGSLALMREALARTPDSRAYKKAVSVGARQIPGVPVVEQGFGVLDAMAAWNEFRDLGSVPVIRPLVLDGSEFREGGLSYTAPAPTRANLYVGSFTPWLVRLDLKSTVPWVSVDRDRVTLPPVQERLLGVNYSIPDLPGLYSGLITGNDPSTRGIDMAVLNTVIVPYRLEPRNQWGVSLSDVLPAAQYHRYYFEVPPGADEVAFSLRVIKGLRAEALGRAKFYVYQPNGREVTASGYVGLGQDTQGESVTRTVLKPDAGVWEVVVESDPALSQYGRGDTYYQIRAKASGVLFDSPPITRWVPADRAGTYLDISVDVLNATGAPATGKVVGMGLARSDPFRRSETLTVTEREAVMRQLPEVIAGTALLSVWARNPAVSADLDLYVYRYDTLKRQWVEAASSAQKGSSEEFVNIPNPEPGQYVAYVEAYNLGGGSTSFEYGYAVLRNDGTISVTDETSERQPNQRWTVGVRIQVPSSSGTYYGNLLFVSEQGYRGRLPLVIHVGKPEARISVTPLLLRRDVPNQVTIKVTDPRDGDPAGRAVDVNGRLYHLSSGRVVLDITPEGDEVELTVKVCDPDWAEIPVTFRLGVGDGPAPAGESPGESFHTKVLHQMGQ